MEMKMARTKKNSINTIMIIFLIGALILGFANSSFAGKISEFTADQVMINPSGSVVHEGKLYFRSDRIRMNTSSPQGDQEMVIIFRRDLKLNWMLNLKGKTYFERPLDEKEMEQTVSKTAHVTEEKILGTETVNGFKCTKKKIKTTATFMGFKNSSESTVWVSNELDMPIRTKSSDGSLTEIRNLKKGAPAKSYFELPKGYRKVSNMMELFMEDAGQERGGAGDGSGLPFKMPKGFPFGNK
jgi:outer membrane lipoprotein-sorting protein